MKIYKDQSPYDIIQSNNAYEDVTINWMTDRTCQIQNILEIYSIIKPIKLIEYSDNCIVVCQREIFKIGEYGNYFLSLYIDGMLNIKYELKLSDKEEMCMYNLTHLKAFADKS